ncbi:hypothetical protein H4R35_004912 [Dimargaris xerosporica]|nr:hypothetical protein H4R35_004912 [Dimargaris xerosporica]
MTLTSNTIPLPSLEQTMTSDPVGSFKDSWRFAFVHAFCVRFGFLTGTSNQPFDINELELALQSDHSDYLQALVTQLLQAASNSRTLTNDPSAWQQVLMDHVFRRTRESPLVWESFSPSLDQGFFALDAQQKVEVIWFLCEDLLQNNKELHDFISTTIAAKNPKNGSIQIESFFADSQYKYYYFNDGSPWIYGETDPLGPKHQWKTLTSSLDEFNKFVETLGQSTQRYQRILYRLVTKDIVPQVERATAKKRQIERSKLKTAKLHSDAQILNTRTRQRPTPKYTFDDDFVTEFDDDEY